MGGRRCLERSQTKSAKRVDEQCTPTVTRNLPRGVQITRNERSTFDTRTHAPASAASICRGSSPAPAALCRSASACAFGIFPSPVNRVACSSAAARCGSLMVTPSIWETPQTACTRAWDSRGFSGRVVPPFPPLSATPSPKSRPRSASLSPGRGVTLRRPHAQTTPAAPVRPIFFVLARLAASANSVWNAPEFPSISVPFTPIAHSVCVSAVGSSLPGSCAARSRIIPSALGFGSVTSSIASDHARLAHW
mmetsp:Transcript_4327/g.16025  ORF Transcript_4327/g.16025 Transcript_4327/m.16025 type:complete len:250 (+) Transcript_4327:2422-3171(+)